ncbi:peptide-methionine (S)-S-oxide reductase MsrA [Pararhizobium qamdonense]|uniref:peptide-methionine (S)-S-oxide reductase MsrA n=1 Tax=Pararhizobium qamdonense TaxID=3031126 RepID=UPI0023E1A48D|nr:peptide-methionine (S)-S-oxide reductase MsrA [Pararhizobium qamdonense]
MFQMTALFKRAGTVRPLLIAGGFLGVFYSAWSTPGPYAAEQPMILPDPSWDVSDVTSLQTAVFVGGCFWGTQGVFQRVNGVVSTAAGYAGGSAQTAVYELTETGTTGHAEAVRVVYDASKVSYGTLLKVFFSVAHDPTQRDSQGADVGTQYRSAIFPQSAEQGIVASGYIKQIDIAHLFKAPIATTVEAGKTFFEAEDYHQDYLVNHPTEPYIAYVEQPKVEALKQLYPSLWREQPLLTIDNRG